MHATLLKALGALIPAGLLWVGSLVLVLRGKTLPAFLQVAGSGGLVVVALAHLCEALHWFPWMGWGLEHSAGHYLDLACALLGLTLFPAGFLLHAILGKRP